MGLFNFFKKSRDKPTNATAGSAYRFFPGRTTSGQVVTERTAMQMTAVYACVRVLSEAVAGLPLNLYKATETGADKATDHSLYALLHDAPNPEMTSFVFRETLMTHLLLWGNAYAQIIRNGRGEVVALYPLMPSKMSVDRGDTGLIEYTYQTSTDEANTKENKSVKLKPSEVLHIPGLGFDGLVGYSPIAMAKNAIGMSIACEEYGATFFANVRRRDAAFVLRNFLEETKTASPCLHPCLQNSVPLSPRDKDMGNKVKYNIKNVHAAKLTETVTNGVVTYSYGTPKAIPGAVSISFDPEGDMKPFYADGMVYYRSLNNNGYAGDLEMALIPEWFRTEILQETLDAKGVLIEKSDSKENVRFALLFEFDGDVNAIRHVFYNCSTGRPGVESETKEDSIEPGTEKLSITADPRADGVVKARSGDTTNSTVYTNWYKSVYEMTTKA